MGFLSKGTPLDWEASKKFHAYIKKHGIIQFLNIWNSVHSRMNDKFLWGDEVEHLLVYTDHEKKRVMLSLTADKVLQSLNKVKEILKARDPSLKFNANFLPEFGSFMIEATPGSPYGGYSTDLRLVEANMALRREMIEQALGPNERLMTLTCFPLMGVGEFSHPPCSPNGPVARSRFIGDSVIGAHARFATLSQNIRARRGSKVCIRMPLFQDVNTKEAIDAEVAAGMHEQPSDIPDEQIDPYKEIYMDAMAFGMGMCCLQVTFQCRSVREARQLYDHLAVLAPLMLALTAATPFFRGKLADTDVRWSVISQSVDDRPPEERGVGLSPSEYEEAMSGKKKHKGVFNKSRYDSIDCYLSQEKNFHPKYNDLDLVYDQTTYDTLKAHGIDELLARHIAHLYIRDPLVIYSEHIELDDKQFTDHFENIQSTNWQTVRFKPPPLNTETGWRVEFRSMEVQLTDFENAAFTVFIALLSRAILFFDLNLYMPISLVDQNLAIAHKRDACRTAKFHWRKVIKTLEGEGSDDTQLLTMQEIMCGRGTEECPGLLALVHAYLDMIKCDKRTRKQVNCYLELVRMRASGELLTAATWFRKYIQTNPNYKQDSNLNETLCYELIETCHNIAQGEIEVPQLLANLADIKRKKQAARMTSRGLSEEDLSAAPLRGASFRLDFSVPQGVSQFHNDFRSKLRDTTDQRPPVTRVVNLNS